MRRQNSDWVRNPTKKQLILTILSWLVGIILITISTTNIFTESAFQKKYLGFGLLLFMATVTLFFVCKNYINNHS